MEDEVGRACYTHGRREEYIEGFRRKETTRQEDNITKHSGKN
jgi:hypothetical protein